MVICLLRFFLFYKDDLLFNKVVIQLYIYLGIGYDVNNVVDGNIVMCMRIKVIGLNNFDKIVWWRVDFGGFRNIYSISVLFKNYNGYGDYNLFLKLYFKFCVYMQYYDVNFEFFNNVIFVLKYNGFVEKCLCLNDDDY